MNADNFILFLDAAQAEALPERESNMFSLRYGLSGAKTHTLAEIGNQHGISRERVRQLLKRSHRRILSMAKRQLKIGKTDFPCAELLLYIRDVIQPEEVNSNDRFLGFIEEGLSFLIPNDQILEFISKLAYPTSELALEHFASARDLIIKHRLEKSRDLRESLLLEKTRRLLSQAIWPKKVNRLATEHIERLKRHREVSLVGDGNAGFFFSNKLSRNVQYESDLERRFLQQIESDDNIIIYQEQPLEISYEIGDKKLVYFPDVIVISNDYRGIIVEIKPVFHMALRENLIKWEALKRFCEKYGLGLLITDGKSTIKQIQKHKIKDEYLTEILSCLEKGPIFWNQYKQIRDKHNPGRNDFVAMILKKGLCWQLGPFQLSLH